MFLSKRVIKVTPRASRMLTSSIREKKRTEVLSGKQTGGMTSGSENPPSLSAAIKGTKEMTIPITSVIIVTIYFLMPHSAVYLKYGGRKLFKR